MHGKQYTRRTIIFVAAVDCCYRGDYRCCSRDSVSNQTHWNHNRGTAAAGMVFLHRRVIYCSEYHNQPRLLGLETVRWCVRGHRWSLCERPSIVDQSGDYNYICGDSRIDRNLYRCQQDRYGFSRSRLGPRHFRHSHRYSGCYGVVQCVYLGHRFTHPFRNFQHHRRFSCHCFYIQAEVIRG